MSSMYFSRLLPTFSSKYYIVTSQNQTFNQGAGTGVSDYLVIKANELQKENNEYLIEALKQNYRSAFIDRNQITDGQCYTHLLKKSIIKRTVLKRKLL